MQQWDAHARALLESGSASSAIQGLQNDVAGLQATVAGLTTDFGALSALVDQICAVPVIDLVVACP